MTPFELDFSSLPIVYLRVPTQLDEAAIQHFFESAKPQLESAKEPFALIIELADLRRLKPRHGRSIARWLKEHQALLLKSCVAQAFVVNTALQRQIVKGLFLVQPPPLPCATFCQIDEAQAWLRDHLPANSTS